MSKRPIVAAALLATGGALAALVVGSAALPAVAAPHGRVLHYTTTYVSGAALDLGKKGDSAGDRNSDVFTVESHGKRVGTFAQDCVLVRPGHDSLALCTGTILLGGSTLAVSDAPSSAGGVLHVAVTGGTGRFAGARGTIDVKTGETATLTVRLRP